MFTDNIFYIQCHFKKTLLLSAICAHGIVLAKIMWLRYGKLTVKCGPSFIIPRHTVLLLPKWVLKIIMATPS